jgi:hypothetical protein
MSYLQKKELYFPPTETKSKAKCHKIWIHNITEDILKKKISILLQLRVEDNSPDMY